LTKRAEYGFEYVSRKEDKMKRIAMLGLFLMVLSCAYGADASATAPVTEADASVAAPASSGDVWKEIFPDGLVDADGNALPMEAIQGKMVGVYFSAHWCPPCKAFSPKLVDFRNANAQDFEVVFVSSDKDEAGQQEYMKELKMPWPTLKFGSAAGDVLGEKFAVQSIPTLVILGPDGKTITTDGRGMVANSPDTCLEEWKKTAGK
jgi:nucleoredoxin